MTNNKKFKAGDVINVKLGEVGTKQIIGHEQGNNRPCVVIKSFRGLLIILPITSKKPKNISYYHIKIEKGIANLTYES